MRLLLIIILLGALAAGGFLTKPNMETMRKHAEGVLADKQKSDDKIGDLIGNVIGGINHSDQFEDMVVASKFTRRSSGKTLIECYGAYSQFFCNEPDEKK